ncbi:MAG: YceI family protein [Chlorobi bacterium]|nr:YceI family protein [Chlorobiota bacterium]
MKKPLKSSRALWILTLLTLLVLSCNQSIDKGSVQTINKIDTSEIKPPVQSEEEIASFDSLAKANIINPDAETFILDTDKSIINWYCVIHSGYTKFKKGSVQFVDGNIVGGGFEIRMDSINDVDIDYKLMRDVLVNTLKSPDFFDIEKFPYAHFDLVRVKEISAENFEVVGNLTLKNVTNQIRFQSNIQYQDSLIKVGSERFSIDRTKWGITIYSENFEQTDKSFLFTDLVEIQISLLLVK